MLFGKHFGLDGQALFGFVRMSGSFFDTQGGSSYCHKNCYLILISFIYHTSKRANNQI